MRRVVPTDTSAGMLGAAHAAPADGPDRYATRQIDLTRDPLDERVDLAVSAMALHHIPDTGAILAAIRDTLNPGGWVALADLDADPENHFHSDGHDGHRGIDRDDLCRRLRELGFEDVTAETGTRIRKTKHEVEREFTVFLVTGHLQGDAAPRV